MSDVASGQALRAQLERCAEPAVFLAFVNQLANFEHKFELPGWLAAFSATARQLGRAAAAGEACVTTSIGNVPLREFTADVLGRALLLQTVARSAADQLDLAVWSAYREGDALEQVAVVRSLALLPASERFLDLCLHAGRTNDARLFRAVACDNPFPARCYPELEWNKLVMKAAFVDAPLDRMLGARERENPELARMALEYIEEQESAGRRFPPAILSVMATFPRPGAVAKLLGYASHAVVELRLAAALALGRVAQARIASFLNERLEVETDERVRTALAAAISALAEEKRAP